MTFVKVNFCLKLLAIVQAYDGPPLELAGSLLGALTAISFAKPVDDPKGRTYGDCFDVSDFAEKFKVIDRHTWIIRKLRIDVKPFLRVEDKDPDY